MPAPASSEIESTAKGSLQSAGLRGENAPDLAAALGQCCGQALALFVSMGMVLPGIPAVAPPPAMSGSTVGPGSLMPPPAGGPNDAIIEPLALAALSAHKINGESKPKLARAIAQTAAQALTLFTTMVKVAPGIPIAGGATASPGMLLGAAPPKPMLKGIALGFLMAGGIRGENAPDLADAMADTLHQTLTQMMSRLKVTPGIPCSPGASAGPGRLV
jgi:hypothetical protein